MKWIVFKSSAYPHDFSIVEKDNWKQNWGQLFSIIMHINRWVGLRFAYLFYHLGFSANLLSIVRVVLAAVGLYLVFYHSFESIYGPLIGIFLLAWQVNLDFADGAIARVLNKTSALGEKLDGLANDFARGGVLILISICTGIDYLFIMGIVSTIILIKLFSETFSFVEKNYSWLEYPYFVKVIRKLLSVPVMVVVLPMIICVSDILGYQKTIFSLVLTIAYTLIAISWLVIISNASKK
jgi:phosphatidylglycerophosphate synthase